jgi:UDP-2,3-diacylglucosamine pyrophosphatase LpxH
MKRVLISCMAVVMLAGFSSSAAGFTFSSTPAFKAVSAPNRTIVIISDLHLGFGKRADGSWYRTEDFRWPKAFKSFLVEISREGKDQVDLIIAGDLLDMWQPPANIRCQGASSDKNLGCTVEEMRKIASWIVNAHPQVFEALLEFSEKGENRLHIIPGNHDASLLIAAVWEPIGKALNADSGRINFVSTGIWVSTDGKIVVDHGHQIGKDVNRYDTWPDIVRNKNGKEYIIRTWGEQFIQQIFNDKEEEYSIIDNLSPESASIRYLWEERNIRGKASDTTKFVAFNLFQTSLHQKVQVLGPEDDAQSPESEIKWNIARARKLGHQLFLAALPKSSTFRAQLLEDTDQAKEIRREFDKLALDRERFPDENVGMLCDLAAFQGDSVCTEPELGGAIEQIKILISRSRVLATYLAPMQVKFPRMRYFIYGHTHEFEKTWQPRGISSTWVLNSGAFQRVINEKDYIKLVNSKAKGISPAKGLRTIKVEELPAYYTYVQIPYKKDPELKHWIMKESDDTGRSESIN